MSATYVEGRASFEGRAGGEMVLMQFPDQSILLSRHDFVALVMNMRKYVDDDFASQKAQILRHPAIKAAR